MRTIAGIFAGAALLASGPVKAETNGCGKLPDNTQLRRALIAARSAENSGLNSQQWATIVDRDGVVCAVAFTGFDRNGQMSLGRVSSAMRANSANAFSYDSGSAGNGKGMPGGLALSTSNLYSSTQPGGFVAGMPNSFPVNQAAAFSAHTDRFGRADDPMVGHPIGGFSAIGGGVGLFGVGQAAVGGVGVAGDHTCTDHDVAWRVRNLLGFDHLAGLPPLSGDPDRPDNIVYDIAVSGATAGVSASGLGHPKCPNAGDQTKLPAVRP